MIRADTQQRYLEAIRDIRTILLGPCPTKIVGVLASKDIPVYLRRWTLSSEFIQGDIRADFQRILTGLDKAIEDHPGEPWLRLMRGRALTALGYYMAAIQDFEACLAIDCAERCLFLAETYFHQARQTFNERLVYYTSAAIYATKSIQFHTPECNGPRPYLIRAQADAHIALQCGYEVGSASFSRKYKEIEVDLRMARKLSDEAEKAIVDGVKANIDALLSLSNDKS